MTPYILIVDDDANVRRVMRRILGDAGFDIREASTALEALAHVEVEPPVVAYCDVHMPGANGLWLADQIRRASPATAMVLATGDADVPPFESFRSGIVAYLLKPLDRRDVLAALVDGIRWHEHAPATPSQPRVARRLTAGVEP